MVEQIQELLDRIHAAPSTIGDTRVITIDGPAGSGKTTLARILNAGLEDSTVIHMDDLYEGWDSTLTSQLSQKIFTIFDSSIQSGLITYRPYDWISQSHGSEVSYPLPRFVILEGVGSGQRIVRPFVSFSIWIWAPKDIRLQRGLERDGEHLKSEWLNFQLLEDQHFAQEQTQGAADYCLNGAP